MGSIRFQVPHPERINESAVERSYMAGLDGIPWPCQTSLSGDCLIVSRETSESGNFYISWPVRGYGEVILSTASLMERDTSYYLPVELARGTINRIRNQMAIWELAGFVVSENVRVTLRSSVSIFSSVVAGGLNYSAAIDSVEDATAKALRALDLLVSSYTEQAFQLRHRQVGKLQTVFGVNLGGAPIGDLRSTQLVQAFNSAVVPMVWRDVEKTIGQSTWTSYDQQVEWCVRRAIRIIGGPLISLDATEVPDWLMLWEDDFEALQSYVLGFTDTVVRRYCGRVALWNGTARLNSSDTIQLTDENRLSLMVRVIERIRQIDDRTPILITFDHPWGDCVTYRKTGMTSLHFGDALSRAGIGLSGFGLEINFGYWPDGVGARDLLDIARQLDRWSLLGLPLVVFLTVPSSDQKDFGAHKPSQSLNSLTDERLSGETQRVLVQQLISLLLTKQSVHGIVWNQLDDQQPHEFPYGGLYDAAGNTKPLLDTLISIRQEHLA